MVAQHTCLADGDFDAMDPWFELFAKALPLAEARTRLWFQHGGAWFHEMMWTFGVRIAWQDEFRGYQAPFSVLVTPRCAACTTSSQVASEGSTRGNHVGAAQR